MSRTQEPTVPRYLAMSFLLIGIALWPMANALADREPTAEERVQIEQVLRDAGFTAWGEIEFDDDEWEVDDAVAEDGKKYELKLDKSLKIIKRERDD